MESPNIGGRQTTSGLFKELTKKGWEKDVCYSLDIFKSTFLACGDSSGYICAQELLTQVDPKERWNEWNRIFFNPRMRNILEGWKEELEIRVRANAESLVAAGCDKETFPRLRFILDGGLYGKRKVGRPTKGERTKQERIKEGVKTLNTKNPKALDEVIGLAGNESEKE